MMAVRMLGLPALLALTCTVTLHAQAPADTLRFTAFLGQVALHHPIARQAGLLQDMAAAELQEARGALDPALVGDYRAKTLGGTEYYDNLNAAAKLPVLGIGDLSLGYDYTRGTYVNPETASPSDATAGQGLAYVGLTVPLLKNLIMDDRRAAIRQARLLPELNDAERLKLVNKLLLNAGKTYWNWWMAWQQYEQLREGLALAEFRYRGTVQQVINGDRAPIDTVEARIEVLRRQVQLAEGTVAYGNARLRMEVFLWGPELAWEELPQNLYPEGLLPYDYQALPPTDSLALQAQQTHPAVRSQQIKLEQQRIAQQLARVNVLPDLVVDLKPYLYEEAGTLGPLSETTSEPISFDTNYRLAVGLYIPLLFRKERGKLAQARIKVAQNQALLQDLQRNQGAELRQREAEYRTLDQLVGAQAEQAQQTARLLAGENAIFQQGEGSLFLINQRERTVLEARLKLIELQAKREQSRLEVLEAAGIPLENLAQPL